MTFFLFGFNLHLSMNNRSNLDLRKPRQGVIIHVARKLLQARNLKFCHYVLVNAFFFFFSVFKVCLDVFHIAVILKNVLLA